MALRVLPRQKIVVRLDSYRVLLERLSRRRGFGSRLCGGRMVGEVGVGYFGNYPGRMVVGWEYVKLGR